MDGRTVPSSTDRSYVRRGQENRPFVHEEGLIVMKTKRMGRQYFSLPFGETVIFILVTFAMVIGLFPGMSVKAYADPSGTGVSSLPSTAGTYYLTDNVTISSSWTPVNGIMVRPSQ